MIYFTRPLQERVHDLFSRSLASSGSSGSARTSRSGSRRTSATTSRSSRARSCSGGCTDGLRARGHRRVARRAEAVSALLGGAAARLRAADRRRAAPRRRRRGDGDLPAIWQRAHARCASARRRTRSRSQPGTSTSRRPTITCWSSRRGLFALSTERRCSGRGRRSTCCSRRAADAYGERVIGVVLTGASADGSQGLTRDQRARRLRAGPGAGDGRVRVMPQRGARGDAASITCWRCDGARPRRSARWPAAGGGAPMSDVQHPPRRRPPREPAGARGDPRRTRGHTLVRANSGARGAEGGAAPGLRADPDGRRDARTSTATRPPS